MGTPRSLSALRIEDPALARLLAVAAAVKLATLVVIVLAFRFLPFCEECYRANFRYPAGEPIGLASAFKTWDGHHYLRLAEQGYSPDHLSNVFYPLYPMAVRVLRPLFFGNTLVAGLVLSHACFFAFLCFLYALAKDLVGEEAAYRSGLLCLAFPTSFFTGLVFSEALFMLLTAASLWALRRGHGALASVSALLLPLSRPQGVLMLAPALWQAGASLRAGRRAQARAALLTVALVPVGFAVYLLVMKAATGDFLAGFGSQRFFVAQNTLANLFHPVRWFTANFIDVDLTLHGFTTSAVDRLFFVLFLATLIPISRHVDRLLLVYALVLGLMGALAGTMMSYTRYLLPVFPIFIALAASLGRRYVLVLVPSALLQVVFLVAHCLNYWIA